MADEVDVVIIGAGPYGLAMAAYLAARNIETRIFGVPMESWSEAMPPGMKLKSDGFASDLYSPAGAFTMKEYCQAHLKAYSDIGTAVELETFVEYGREFQRRFVPWVETEKVTSVVAERDRFRIKLDSGETFHARRVVSATGIRQFSHIPEVLRGLPPDLCTHSACYGPLSHLAGKEVLIVGSGSSAGDLAALLLRNGARPTIAARNSGMIFHQRTVRRSLIDKIRAPMTILGAGWRNVLYSRAPLLFHRLPESLRIRVVRRHLGPSIGWHMRKEVEQVPFIPNVTVASVSEKGGRLKVVLRRDGGSSRSLAADHIIAATGYKVDVQRLDYLDEFIKLALRLVDKAPALSTSFESSVPGLYFVGASAANSFGPLLRFVVGAKFASERISKHILLKSRNHATVRQSISKVLQVHGAAR